VRHDDAAARLADEAAHALGLHSIVCQPARAVTPRMLAATFCMESRLDALRARCRARPACRAATCSADSGVRGGGAVRERLREGAGVPAIARARATRGAQYSGRLCATRRSQRKPSEQNMRADEESWELDGRGVC
jgi:hypothetical protein